MTEKLNEALDLANDTGKIVLLEIMHKTIIKCYPGHKFYPEKSKSSFWISGMKEWIKPIEPKKQPKKEEEQKPLFKTENLGKKGF